MQRNQSRKDPAMRLPDDGRAKAQPYCQIAAPMLTTEYKFETRSRVCETYLSAPGVQEDSDKYLLQVLQNKQPDELEPPSEIGALKSLLGTPLQQHQRVLEGLKAANFPTASLRQHQPLLGKTTKFLQQNKPRPYHPMQHELSKPKFPQGKQQQPQRGRPNTGREFPGRQAVEPESRPFSAEHQQQRQDAVLTSLVHQHRQTNGGEVKNFNNNKTQQQHDLQVRNVNAGGRPQQQQPGHQQSRQQYPRQQQPQQRQEQHPAQPELQPAYDFLQTKIKQRQAAPALEARDFLAPANSKQRQVATSVVEARVVKQPQAASGVEARVVKQPHAATAVEARAAAKQAESSAAAPPAQQQHQPLLIRYAGCSVRRAVVASVDPSVVAGSAKTLIFNPYHKPSFSHLEGSNLHTLAIVNRRNYNGHEEAERDGMARWSARMVADSMAEVISADMSKVVNNVKSFLESRLFRGCKPKLCIRLGKMLFHNRQRYNRFDLAEVKPFDGRTLQDFLGPDKGIDERLECYVSKTFESGVSFDFFRKVRGMLLECSSSMVVDKEKFIIQVADAQAPSANLLCICKRTTEGDLELWKVHVDHLRHMVVDFACMEKDADVRLILTTKEEFKGNSGETLQALVEKAKYQANNQEILTWPRGITRVGQYSVIGVTHLHQSNFTCGRRRWKLRHASRWDLKTLTGRYSYEIDGTTDEWTKEFKVWKQLYKDKRTGAVRSEGSPRSDLIQPLSSLLEWVWQKCI